MDRNKWSSPCLTDKNLAMSHYNSLGYTSNNTHLTGNTFIILIISYDLLKK